MVDSKIPPYSCDPGFGNPCYEAMITTSFSLFFILDIFMNPETSKMDRFRGVVRGIVISSICCFIGYSKMFIGDSALNQVIFGVQVGLWLVLYFHFCIQPALTAHLHKLMVFNNPYSSKKVQPKYLKYFTFATLLITMVIGSSMVTYGIVNRSVDLEYNLQSAIYEACGIK